MNEDKTLVMRASMTERQLWLNPEYKDLPKPVVSDLISLLGLLAEKIKGEATLWVRDDSSAVLSVWAGDAEPAKAKALADHFAALHKKNLAAVGKWHALYKTEKGREILKRFIDENEDKES